MKVVDLEEAVSMIDSMDQDTVKRHELDGFDIVQGTLPNGETVYVVSSAFSSAAVLPISSHAFSCNN